jgi:predicted nuclease of predicted toxin-antitoxin system
VARLYGNENVSLRIVEALRALGHDVLTSHEAGNANQGIPDEEVLAFALANMRIVLTNNRKDFIRLHTAGNDHAGIAVYTLDPDAKALAARIESALKIPDATGRFLCRIGRLGSTFDA